MKKPLYQTAAGIICLAAILAGCGCEKKQSSPVPFSMLVQTASDGRSVDGTSLISWMESSAAYTVYKNEGAVEIIRKRGLQKETQYVFEEDGHTYSILSTEQLSGPQVSQTVNLICANEKSQHNINLQLNGEKQIVSVSSFQREPLWPVSEHQYARNALLELVSDEGISILRAFPEYFSGTLFEKENLEMTWRVIDAAGLRQRISKSRFAKSGYVPKENQECSWMMTQAGDILSAGSSSSTGEGMSWTAEVHSCSLSARQKAEVMECFQKYPPGQD